MSKHVISVLLANESGVLSRVAGLFSARGYNIESLTVAATNNPLLSRITIVTKGEDKLAEQVIKQLHKLIDVLGAVDLGQDQHVEREVLLVKLVCEEAKVNDLKTFVSTYRAGIIECDASLCIVGMTALGSEIDKFILALEKVWDIKEIARSGTISLGRGNLILSL